MLILFTKSNCTKCDIVKQLIKDMGMTEDIHIKLYIPGAVSMTNVDVLADMAFYEIVTTAETMMPILVAKHEDNSFAIYAGYIKIRKYLEVIK